MKILPLPLKPKIIQEKKNIGLIEIKGLYRGYGVTIGNSLRRILLSSIQGSAITQVKIKNVSHEFSTLPYVKEDVVQIIMNLKKLRFKLCTSESQKTVLKVKGERIVYGSDFKLPAGLELANKNEKIATLTDKRAEIEIEAKIEQGIGYMPIEEREEDKPEIGVIFLDAFYSPVIRVCTKIKNMRVEKRTDFDKLTIEIETDGTITPLQAFLSAVNILMKHLSLFKETFKDLEKKEEKKEIEFLLKSDIKNLNFSQRTTSSLLEAKIKTLNDILKRSRGELKENVKGLGEKGIEEIKEKIQEMGFSLR